MNGGYQILDLRKLDINLEDSEVSISDPEVEKQLLNIANILNKETGLLSDIQPKPIYILMPNGAGFGAITNPEAETLLIDAYIMGGHFYIGAVYNVNTDEYDNLVLYLVSAKYSYDVVPVESGTKLYRHELTFTGNETDTVIEIITNSKNNLINQLGRFDLMSTNNIISARYKNIDNFDYWCILISFYFGAQDNEFGGYFIDDSDILGIGEETIEDYSETITEL